MKRHEGYLTAEMGNMLPLIEGKQGVSMTSSRGRASQGRIRQALDHRQPRARLPPTEACRPDPGSSFFDELGLLITSSDDSVKIWDGSTGALRKEIPGQIIRPLFFLQCKSGARQFATLDTAGRVVTVWDAKTLDAVMTFEPKTPGRLLGGALGGWSDPGDDRRRPFRNPAANRHEAAICHPPLTLPAARLGLRG